MGAIDCITNAADVTGYLYDTIYALIVSQVTQDVTVLTLPRRTNGSDMPEQYVFIAIHEMAVSKHSMSPCSFAQGLSIAVDVLLPYHMDELSRQLIRSVQALFLTQLEYAMLFESAKTSDATLPQGKLSTVIVDVNVILRGQL